MIYAICKKTLENKSQYFKSERDIIALYYNSVESKLMFMLLIYDNYDTLICNGNTVQ